MNYVKAKQNWEEVFIQQAIELEEKMNSIDLSALNQSRLRIALEKNILNWNDYKNWLSTEINCSILNDSIDINKKNDLLKRSSIAYEAFSHYQFWSEDLIPLDTWDENLIVIGLERNERLNELPKAIFILASPEVLTTFAKNIFPTEIGSETNSGYSSDENSVQVSIENSNESSLLDGIDMHIAPPKIAFDAHSLSANLSNLSATTNEQEIGPGASVWDYISERHDEYCFEVKKQFDAYLVLRVSSNKTSVFKMDEELQNKNLNAQIFDYSLSENNPFKKVFESGLSESFNMNQLGVQILDFKYACITPLKRAHKIVGFLVGLKNKNLADTDQELLEDLAKESA